MAKTTTKTTRRNRKRKFTPKKTATQLQNEKRLREEKDKLLQKRAVIQEIKSDDFVFKNNFERNVFNALFKDGLKARITAKHIKCYLQENNKRDKSLKKEELIMAKSDFTGKEDNNYYNLHHITGLKFTETDGLQANVAWRGTDKRGKRFTNSMVKPDMFHREETLQHHAEYMELEAAIKNYTSRHAHFYTSVNDGYKSK